MKIGILGSGDVGRKLADGFIELGHTVKIGSRNPNQDKITEWMAKHDKTKVLSGTFAEATSFGELDVIATLWTGTVDAIKMADPKNFANKIVIDVTVDKPCIFFNIKQIIKATSYIVTLYTSNYINLVAIVTNW